MPKDETIDTLNDLISTCRDAEEGYSKAAKGVHRREVRDRFLTCARRRSEFADELKEHVVRLGGTPAEAGHGGGVLHRGWVDLEQRIRPKTEAEFIMNCLNGEAETINHYRQAMSRPIPEDLRDMIERHFLEVERTMRELENLPGRSLKAE